jgi:hypothetical protein
VHGSIGGSRRERRRRVRPSSRVTPPPSGRPRTVGRQRPAMTLLKKAGVDLSEPSTIQAVIAAG